MTTPQHTVALQQVHPILPGARHRVCIAGAGMPVDGLAPTGPRDFTAAAEASKRGRV